MSITAEEKSAYIKFSLELAAELGSISIPPDTLLWHYTNGPALISILETMTLYSTQLSCLNDTTELRYGSRLFQEALRTKRAAILEEGMEAALLDGALKYFAEDPDFPAQAVVPHFVACFTEEQDDLSQWRAYGGGENGYAIGFRARDLWGCENASLVRINYDAVKHHKLAEKAGDAMISFFLEAAGKHRPPDLVSFGKEFLEAWEAAITMVAPLIKDPAFVKERECRITKGFVGGDLEKLKFIQKEGLMSRHLPLQPSSDRSKDSYRLPICEVMIGPCRHPQISRISVDTLLRQKGYPGGLVSISQIPFQKT
jgi:hypothetical protein